MTLPNGRWHVSPRQFPGPSTSKDNLQCPRWLKKERPVLPSKSELIYAWDLQRNQDALFWVLRFAPVSSHWAQPVNTEIFKTINCQSCFYLTYIWSVSLLQTWQNQNFSITAEQSVAPIYKQEPKAHSMHSCWRKLPSGGPSASYRTDSYQVWSFPDAPSLVLFAFLFAALILCI